VRAELERKLAELVLPHLIGARVIAAYHPLKDEISPYPILDRLGPGQQAALPWFGGRDDRMIWRQAPAVEPSPWGVLQPSGDADALAPDLVLVPLVSADRAGTRIGHGKGHYDRALSHLRDGGLPVTTIGLAWEIQLSEAALEADPWDQPLDAIATPKEWIQCLKR
jgi:5-formyltetrahydrofolate cyclo-ligase